MNVNGESPQMINIKAHILQDNCSGSKIPQLFLVDEGPWFLGSWATCAVVPEGLDARGGKSAVCCWICQSCQPVSCPAARILFTFV